MSVAVVTGRLCVLAQESVLGGSGYRVEAVGAELGDLPLPAVPA